LREANMYCTRCGKEQTEGSRFCSSCGRPLVPVAAAPRATETSGKAIASLVLGILGVTCLPTAIAGLILGILALSDIGKSGGKLGGRGLAIAGTVISLVPLLSLLLALVAILVIVILTVLGGHRREAMVHAASTLGPAR